MKGNSELTFLGLNEMNFVHRSKAQFSMKNNSPSHH